MKLLTCSYPRCSRGIELFIADSKVCDLRERRNGPRKNIQQVQRRNGVEMSEHGIDSDHAEDTRAENDDDRRRKALSDAAAGRDRAIHKRADGV